MSETPDAPLKRFLFVVTTGVSEPRKAFTPFYYAAAAAAMDHETWMFFVAEGPSLLAPGVADTVRTTPESEPLTSVIELGKESGVKFFVCSVSAKVIWKLDVLPDGMEFAGAATLLDAATDPNTVILYF
jgi:predicted peroxiredoxin